MLIASDEYLTHSHVLGEEIKTVRGSINEGGEEPSESVPAIQQLNADDGSKEEEEGIESEPSPASYPKMVRGRAIRLKHYVLSNPGVEMDLSIGNDNHYENADSCRLIKLSRNARAKSIRSGAVTTLERSEDKVSNDRLNKTSEPFTSDRKTAQRRFERRSIDLENEDLRRLERRYGGKEKTHHAAKIIQTAYRHHRIKHDYQRILVEKQLSNKPLLSSGLMSQHCSARLTLNEVSTEQISLNKTMHCHSMISTPMEPISFDTFTSKEISEKQDTREKLSPCSYTSSTRKKATKAKMEDHSMSFTKKERLKRVFICLFNKNPCKGLKYLIQSGFIVNDVHQIASFLMEEKSLSRVAVGEYFGLINNEQAAAVFIEFLRRLDLSGKCVDNALRYFLSFFHLPGESQKILYIMQAFQSEYVSQNASTIHDQFHDCDTVTVLCYAIIMLHTEWHNPNLTHISRRGQTIYRRMSCNEFIRNLRGVDAGHDLDENLLKDIYQRTIVQKIQVTTDPTTEVVMIARNLTGNCAPANLMDRHRRLVLYTTLYEIDDSGPFFRMHFRKREIFLFNDCLLLSKLTQVNNKSSPPMFSCKRYIPLSNVIVRKYYNQSLFCNVNATSRSPGPGATWLEICQVVDAKVICKLSAGPPSLMAHTGSTDTLYKTLTAPNQAARQQSETQSKTSNLRSNHLTTSNPSLSTITDQPASPTEHLAKPAPSICLNVSSTTLPSSAFFSETDAGVKKLLHFYRLLYESILETREFERLCINEDNEDNNPILNGCGYI